MKVLTDREVTNKKNRQYSPFSIQIDFDDANDMIAFFSLMAEISGNDIDKAVRETMLFDDALAGVVVNNRPTKAKDCFNQLLFESLLPEVYHLMTTINKRTFKTIYDEQLKIREKLC